LTYRRSVTGNIILNTSLINNSKVSKITWPNFEFLKQEYSGTEIKHVNRPHNTIHSRIKCPTQTFMENTNQKAGQSIGKTINVNGSWVL
jgi:hypothetical protein